MKLNYFRIAKDDTDCITSDMTMLMSSLVGDTVVDPLLTAVEPSAELAVVNAVISWFIWLPTVPSVAVWLAWSVTVERH